MNSSEGSAAPHPLSAPSGGSPCSTQQPSILVSKVLTYSDVSTDVARTGRIVLPRIQVQACLPALLHLCGAAAALPAARGANPVKLSADLAVEDEAGRRWVLLLKTWQNVVSGEHRPTFVLENTADFVRANRLAQGGTLAFCPAGDRMLLRTSLRPDQLPPRQAKRVNGGAAAAAVAKRRAAAKPATPSWAPAPAEPLSGRKRRAPSAEPTVPWTECNAEEAAQALVDMHSSASPTSSRSEQLALGGSGSDHEGSVGSPRPAKRAAAASSARGGGTSRAAPAPAPVFRPIATPVPAAGQPVPAAFCPQAALALAATQHQLAAAAVRTQLPPAPPLSAGGPAAGSLPPEALAQARCWLSAILAQQQQERLWVSRYNQLLFLQALQEEQRTVAAQLQRQQLAELRG